MNISQVSFQYRKVIFVFLLAMLAYGAVSYITLPAREDPQIIIREALVITKYPGLNPERIENLITKHLERHIRQIPEVEEIRSSSVTGKSIIHVEIADKYFNLDSIFQDLRDKVSDAQKELPQGTKPSVVNDEMGEVSIITLALRGDGFDFGEMYDMAKHVRDVLYTVEGTKKIELLGVQEERIFLETSNIKLAQLGITPNELIQVLQTQNIIRPGGAVDTGDRAFVIEPTGNFESVEEIGNTYIPIPNSQDMIAFRDIASIRRDYVDPPHEPCYFNGEPAIMFAISMLSGYNVLEFSPRMKEKIEAIEQTLPVGYELDIATYQAEQVAKTVYSVSYNVVQTLVIVLFVVMIFLGMRTGLIVGAIVPIVMLVSLALMNMYGMELERMSLATLIISLGLLVDNGIVIAEDFKRRLEMGDSRDKALKDCGSEMAVPLLSSSLTTILFFMPLMMAEHVAGEYTRSISIVIMMTLMSSWLLALCVTPTLCHYFIKVTPSADTDEMTALNKTWMNRRYSAVLRWMLRHRFLFLMVMVGLFFGAIALMTVVPKKFFPDSDRTQILTYVELPAGTTPRSTNRRMQDVFEWLKDQERFPHIESMVGYVGFGGPRFVLALSPEDPADNKGFIVLNINSEEAMDETLDRLRVGFVEHFPDMFVRVTRMFLGPSDSTKLEVQVKGPDADFIYNKAKQIEDILRKIPGTTDVRNDWENRIINVFVEVDQQRARRAGVSSEDVAKSLQTYFSGQEITEFREDDDLIPIMVRADAEDRFNLDRMRSINVFATARNTFVPLYQVANFAPHVVFSRIERENMFRTVTVEAKSLTMTAEDLKTIVDPQLVEIGKSLPINHSIEYDGVISDSTDAQEALSANLPLVLGLIVVLLVAQFNSYRRPLIILATIPFCLIGVSVGMLITASDFGFMVTLGLYSLAGIILNNGIVLIDRIDMEVASGTRIQEAIVSSCVLRLRPIMMTTVTTILGLLPLILSRDPMFYGMANAMAFGLGIGTVLSLGLVPVLYSLFFRAKVNNIS